MQIRRWLAVFALSGIAVLGASCGSDSPLPPTPPVQQPGIASSPAPHPSIVPGRTTSELSGVWAGKHMVLHVGTDGTMELNLGCISGNLPTLPINPEGRFSSDFSAHSNTPPLSDQTYSGTLSGQVSENHLSVTAILQPPHPFPGHTDTSSDDLVRDQTTPSDPLLCALGS